MGLDAQRRELEAILAPADIRIDGDRAWDLQVRDENFFHRVFADGTLDLGEAYMEGWWDCPALDEFICRAFRAKLESSFRPWRLLHHVITAKLRNLESRRRSLGVGRQHYNTGNDLFRAMLDDRMIYSCGYWARADNLNDAQEHKLDLVARKLDLRPGMRVLDIGCGWGGAARYLAKRYDVDVVGITIAEEQLELGREICAGLPVELRLQDYRDLDGTFDRIYSLGMFEHVGAKNYKTYIDVVRRCLADDGLFLLHTIGTSKTQVHTDPWIRRYIFQVGNLPSAQQIAAAAEGVLTLEDWHSFGPDYDRTLMAWHRNIEDAWPNLGDRYDERFRRAWRYFLLASAGSFRARANDLWQVVFSTGNRETPYRPPGIR